MSPGFSDDKDALQVLRIEETADMLFELYRKGFHDAFEVIFQF